MKKVLLAMMMVGGCGPEFRDGDEHFFVTHKEASMPVWVTGNWRSNRIVVHLHGGPGTTNAIYWQKESYQRLADDVGVVYYEQRASGAAQGNARDHLFVDQYVEDLDVVMTVLEDRYPEAEFVLMGHSWGGHLGSKYLLDSGNQARFRAWIDQDGVVDASCRSQNWARDRVLEYGARVRAGDPKRKEREFWKGAERFYEDVWRCDPDTNENNLIEEYDGKQIDLHHSLYIRAAGGYDVDPERVLTGGETAEIIFETQYDLVAVSAFSPLPMKGYYGVDLTPRLSEITLPTLVLWGTHDLITPWINAKPVFDAHGAPEAQKRLVLFERSGHNPWAEEPDAFYQAVNEFLHTVWPDLD